MGSHVKGSPRLAAEAPIIIERDNDGLSERVPDFMVDFAKTLQLVAKKGNGRTAS